MSSPIPVRQYGRCKRGAGACKLTPRVWPVAGQEARHSPIPDDYTQVQILYVIAWYSKPTQSI